MAAAAEELDVDGITVRLTNPDKVYFPKLGSNGTKRRLVEYYLAVAGGPMLDALRDRPTHLQRFPDGIDGEEIYQKRVPQHHPDYLETCRVTFPSGRTADALKVTHPCGDRVGRADGHDHAAPMAGALPRHRAPRRVAHRSGSAARCRVRTGAHGGGRCAAPAARRTRSGRLSQDVRGSRDPRVPADRHRLGLHRSTPGGHRAGARGRASCAGRGDHLVVERGTRQAHLHRLQPERPRPHHGVGRIRCGAPRSRPCRRR